MTQHEGFRQALVAKNGGRTSRELAEDVGISQPMASRWLNGKGVPSRPNYGTAAEFLGVTVDELVLMIHRDQVDMETRVRILDEPDGFFEASPEYLRSTLERLVERATDDAEDPTSRARAQRALEILREVVGEQPRARRAAQRPPRRGS